MESHLEIKRVKVQDPYEPDKQLEVERNTKTDPIEYMFHREQIDQPQKQAADRFMLLWEKAAFGGARAIDYAQERVDTSGFRSAVPGAAMDAQTALRDARRAVGNSGYSIVVAVCGERHTLDAVARAFYDGSSGAKYLVSVRLKEMLDELANHWGYSSNRIPKRRVLDWSTPDGKASSSG